MPRLYLSYDPAEPDEWTLEAPYERKTSIGSVVVPAGFKTDLASTPRLVWLRFPRWGRWSGAAVVHDWFYRTHPAGVTRYRADRILLELMREDAVRYGDSMTIYRAVREFGDTAWNRKQTA